MARSFRQITRRDKILGLMRKLEWDGFPRLQMLFLVTLTGAAGMASSFVLLKAGMESMFIRYPISVGCAYLVFLFLLWLWIRTNAKDYVDVPPDIQVSGTGKGSSSDNIQDFGGGDGQFGGGGASGSFDMDDSLPSPSLPDINIPGGDSVGEVLSGADEGAVPLVVALIIAALAAMLFLAMLYIVYLSPALFAELLVDGVLSATLYRRLRGLATRHWLESAVRRTALPFVVTALGLAAMGYALERYAPQAHTLGEVHQHYLVQKGTKGPAP